MRRAPALSRSVLAAMLTGCALAGCPLTLASVRAATPRPQTSLPVIERQVMCVTCKIPLNVAQSPQADRERAFIQGLIDKGLGEDQIKHALVGQYGPAALALPAEHGFDLAAYLVPLAALIAVLGALAVLLPRWRRHARAEAAREQPAAALSPADAARLEADLTRFD